MAKKRIAIRIEDDLLEKLEQLSDQTGRTKTDIVKQAIAGIEDKTKQSRQEVELLDKENEQLKIMLSATQAVIAQKDDTIKVKDELIKSKDDLILELRRKKRSFWKRLFDR